MEQQQQQQQEEEILQATSKAYSYIESNIGVHIERIKEIIRIPSIAAENPEAVRKCAQLVLKWFEELGCVEADICETAGSPVVYGRYDAGAENTLLVYMMYDVKQVSGEVWTMVKDPFDPKVVPMPPFKSVVVGRGSVNSKGPLTAFVNSLLSIKAVGEEIPVNLNFIAEGEEELGSQHLMDFAKEHKEYVEKLLLSSRDRVACFAPAPCQNIVGVPSIYLGCKGVVELELECSGEYWERGPTKRGVHSSLAAIVESPMWRMIEALATMVNAKDPSNILIEGFYDNVAPPTEKDIELVEQLAKEFDENSVKVANDVKHFVHDLHGKDLLMKALYSTTLNIQGIYGGYTGPKFKTVLPHSVRVKLESRLIPNQTRSETVDLVKRHLKRYGYTDIKIIDTSSEKSDDWSRTDPDAGIVKVIKEGYETWGYKPHVWPFSLGTSPQYIFTKFLKVPFISAGLGHGGRAHAPDEYFVIEGNAETTTNKKKEVVGLIEAEKFFVYLLQKMGNSKKLG